MPCSPGVADTLVAIDETNASAAVKVTGRAFVVASNDLYNGAQTTRWNRSRFIRITGYAPTYLAFDAIGIPGGTGIIGVVVNNVPFATISVVNTDVIPRRYTVTGMASSVKTVELYEDFQERIDQLDTGVDGKASACYVLRVVLPGGSGGTITKVTAPNVIAALGNSHMDGQATAPVSVNGWVGQLRRAAHAAGTWTVGYVGAGSSTLCGDGPTAAQTAAMIHDLWTQTGAVNKKLLMMKERNDYAYWAFVGSVQTTPAQLQAYEVAIFAALDASDPGWSGICARIPQGTAWGANGGGFTLDDYWAGAVAASTSGGRTNVQTFDKTVFTAAGLSLANPAQWFEANPGQVHMLQPGHDIVAPVARAWYGL